MAMGKGLQRVVAAAFTALLTTAAAPALAEDDAAWADIVAAAKKEGKVKMYSTMVPTINADLEAGFESAYPEIDLEITRTVGMEINATLDAERSTGADGADIVGHVNFDWIFDPAHKDYFTKPLGPNATAATWVGTPYLVNDTIQMSLLTALGIAYNTEFVESAPAGYMDLLKPEFGNGRIGLVDNTHGPATDLYKWMEETFGADYLPKLAAQNPRFYTTAVPLQEALLSGEIAVAVWGVNALVQPAKAKGAPLEFVLGNPGWSTVNFTYMLSWAKRPNAAQVLFDYMASPDGQAVLAKGNISTQPNVPGTLGDISSVTPLDYQRTIDVDWLAKEQADWREIFGR